MVTIKDVAAHAGVNPSTVSRVLKDSPLISPKTATKVRESMEILGYVPNRAAQILARGLTHNIGLIFPPLVTAERLSEPFFMHILSVISGLAKTNDFALQVATAMDPEDLLEQVRLMYQQKRVDGFILLYSDRDDPIRHYLLEEKVPFVVLGNQVDAKDGISYIDNDNRLMGEEALAYLHCQGHERVLFITDDLSTEVAKSRYQGYSRAAKTLGLPTYPAQLFDRENRSAFQDLLVLIKQEQVSALIVIADRVSVSLLHCLSNNGLKVPDDLSLITFNNSSYATLISPFLTTFDVNIDRLGQESFTTLLCQLKSPDLSPVQQIKVPFTLKERDSVRQIRKEETPE